MSTNPRDFNGNFECDKVENHLALKEQKTPSSNGCYRQKKKIKIIGCSIKISSIMSVL